MNDPFVLGGVTLRSRLFIGTGKYGADSLIPAVAEASGAEVITVAMRRVDKGGNEGITSHIPGSMRLLPNTSGARTAEEAVRLDADLVIMGSRGRTALAGLFLGSVTNGVLARTKNPILIVRNKAVPETDAMRVGIAVDGSKFGVAAVKYLVRHKELFGEGASFYLINVASDYAGAVMPDMAGMALPALSESEVLELQKKEFGEAVVPIRPILAKAGLTPKEVCLVGNPGDEIAAFAKKKKLDLVVMGSHGYGRFKSAVMGSTATRIAAQGDVPILLIRR